MFFFFLRNETIYYTLKVRKETSGKDKEKGCWCFAANARLSNQMCFLMSKQCKETHLRLCVQSRPDSEERTREVEHCSQR